MAHETGEHDVVPRIDPRIAIGSIVNFVGLVGAVVSVTLYISSIRAESREANVGVTGKVENLEHRMDRDAADQRDTLRRIELKVDKLDEKLDRKADRSEIVRGRP